MKKSATKKVTMSNKLISANQSENLVELRLLRFAFMESRDQELGFDAKKPLVLKVSDYIQLFNADSKHTYSALKEACDDLFERIFVYFDFAKNELVKIPYLQEARYGDAYIKLTFNPLLRDHIWQLQREFTTIDINEYAHLKNVYATRLYELLYQYKSTGYYRITIPELRTSLNVPKGYLNSDFISRIINPSVAEINGFTNLNVSAHPERTGRKNTHCVFNFKEKPSLKKTNLKNVKNVMSYQDYCLKYKLLDEPLESAMTRLEEAYRNDVARKAPCVLI